MDLKFITFIETTYLFYMFFIFKTNYSINSAIFNDEIQNVNSFFVHDTNKKENKICDFGRVLAIIAIILAWIRVYTKNNEKIITYTISFDVLCILLAFLMNLNAVVYILPLIISEIYIINNID
jgi:hypothetical protein